MNNTMYLKIPALSENEPFARDTVAAFCVRLNPSLDELSDVKTAVSEAVTNCIVHAYPDAVGPVELSAEVKGENQLVVTVSDKGVGIENLERAMQPMYTTGSPDERAGLGFAVMKTFMDEVKVRSRLGKGTRVTLIKYIRSR